MPGNHRPVRAQMPGPLGCMRPKRFQIDQRAFTLKRQPFAQETLNRDAPLANRQRIPRWRAIRRAGRRGPGIALPTRLEGVRSVEHLSDQSGCLNGDRMPRRVRFLLIAGVIVFVVIGVIERNAQRMIEEGHRSTRSRIGA
jgi:hypothetical protein